MVHLLPAVAYALSSAFLAPIGKTIQYRYVDTVTVGKETKREAATLTMRTASRNDIQITIAVDGSWTRSLDFYIDPTGGLQPVSIMEAFAPTPGKRSRDQEERWAASRSLFTRLSLAARIGADPRAETSFPIELNVSWASEPVDPMLFVKPIAPDTFEADAEASTSINPPQKRRRLSVFLTLGLGLAGAFADAATGRFVSAAGVVASSSVRESVPDGPLPIDVKLHLTGQMIDNRIQVLSGVQDSLVHVGKRTRKISDVWSLIET